jgi:electron transfer flavoprotein beta subunit
MNIAVLVKIVADDQDLGFGADGGLDHSRAQSIISAYDLNAIEAAVQLAEATGDATVKALVVGGAQVDESKLKKSILSKGVNELYMFADDRTSDLDARATAVLLTQLLEQAGGADLIIAGDGSADRSAQQVDVQIASLLGLPYVSGVVNIAGEEGGLKIERLLDSITQTLKLSYPAVIAVSPDVATPRIPGMKDILAAGKKPNSVLAVDTVPEATTELVFERQPAQGSRELEYYDASVEGDLDKFIAAVKAAL